MKKYDMQFHRTETLHFLTLLSDTVLYYWYVNFTYVQRNTSLLINVTQVFSYISHFNKIFII